MADGLGFARKQLEKHGWSEGKGLGKEESGISKAIKVNVKTDLAGVGYDAGDQFSFHWWDHVFNKTAKSIVVQESEEGVKVVKSSKEACSVSNKRPSKNTNKPRLYGRFVKASCKTQTQENKTQESDDDSESEKDFSHLCPDERLFQACGGRTAHKAARHGLLLNGKLQRVEKQEKIGNSDIRCDSDTAKRSVLDLKSFVVRDEKQRCKEGKRDSKESKKGKMKKRKYREMLEEENRKLDEVVDDRADLIQSRKKNVKNIVMNGEGDHKLEVHSSCDDYEKVKKGKKKRKCRDLQKGKEYKLEGERDFCGDMAKNQKKKRTKNGDVHGTNDEALSDICFYTNNLDEEGVNSKKRKRKDQLGENDYKLEGTCPDPKYDVDKKRAKKKKKKTLIYRKRTGADFRKVK